MLIAHDILIMVMDGGRMSLFRNAATDRAPKLELLAEKHRESPSTAQMGTDRPGRVNQSRSDTRAAYETTDLHQREEDNFTLKMTELFNAEMANPERRAILVAPPRVLGQIRKHLREDTRSRLTAEINKDYAGRTALELVQLLQHHQD